MNRLYFPNFAYAGRSRAYSYEKISGSVLLPQTFLDAIKNYLKIDTSVTADDDLIIDMTLAAISFIERYTGRTLLTTEYRTWRDWFPCDYIELRRSPLQSLDLFNYIDINGDVKTVDPLVYYNTFESDYSKILPQPGKNFPSDLICKLQSIIIQFTVGYGDTVDDIPAELLVALLQMVAALYDNRGDCIGMSRASAACGCQEALVKGNLAAMLIPYKIYSLVNR